MLDQIAGSSSVIKGFFLMGVGVIGVFIVLIIFYFLIKALIKIFPEKPENKEL